MFVWHHASGKPPSFDVIGTDPRQAGVAVQFLEPIEALRQRLAPIAAAAAGTPPVGAPELTAPEPAATPGGSPLDTLTLDEEMPAPDQPAAQADSLELESEPELDLEPELELESEPGREPELELLEDDEPILSLPAESASAPDFENTQQALTDLEVEPSAPALEADEDSSPFMLPDEPLCQPAEPLPPIAAGEFVPPALRSSRLTAL